MKRVMILGLVLLLVTSLLTGCSDGYEEVVFDETFMYQIGSSLAEDVCKIAGSDRIMEIYGFPEDIRDYTKRISLSDAEDAETIYLLHGSSSFKKLIRAFGSDAGGSLTSKEQKLVEKRLNWATLLSSQYAASFGSTAIAACSACTHPGGSFRVEEAPAENYLMVFVGEAAAIAVSFTTSGEGIVSVSACPMLLLDGDGFEDVLDEYADQLDLTLEILDADDLIK